MGKLNTVEQERLVVISEKDFTIPTPTEVLGGGGRTAGLVVFTLDEYEFTPIMLAYWTNPANGRTYAVNSDFFDTANMTWILEVDGLVQVDGGYFQVDDRLGTQITEPSNVKQYFLTKDMVVQNA